MVLLYVETCFCIGYNHIWDNILHYNFCIYMNYRLAYYIYFCFSYQKLHSFPADNIYTYMYRLKQDLHKICREDVNMLRRYNPDNNRFQIDYVYISFFYSFLSFLFRVIEILFWCIFWTKFLIFS